MKGKRFLRVRLSLVLGVLFLTSALSVAFAGEGPFRVKRVVDGDTIVLADGRRIRYLGINTPEYGEPFWQEAKDYNAGKVRGKSVMLEFGEVKEDKYGRTLAYVFVDGEMVNAQLLAAGWAHLFILEPIGYHDTFQKAQEEARSKGLGIWGPGGFKGPLKITSLHADAPGDDRFNLNGEYVRICNISSKAVALRSFSLVDEEGYRYTFTRGELRPGYTLLLLTGSGGDVLTGDQLFFYWNSAYPIWNNKGDRATLRDPQGAVVDGVIYKDKSS
jgi:micrococcal nuclease